jgi:NAD(P)-dependent dehydrogenase (short-subunit alcohol dehydrogenase family)
MKAHDGKLVVISGAAAVIGQQAIAVRFAQEGARIVVVDRDPATETLKSIQGAGGNAVAVQCDVRDASSVSSLKEAVDKIGNCDILINNVGIYPMQSFDDITFDDWRRVLSTNLDSMFLMTKAFTGRMRKAGWGRIINMASDTVSLLVLALSHYIASKAGVIGFTRALATEFGEYGITVNAVAPGLTRTQGTRVISQTNEALFELTLNMQSIKRGEQPSDLVGAVSFLASQDAAFITGQTLYVNGGITRTT